MLAWDNGRVDVVAETVTAGPWLPPLCRPRARTTGARAVDFVVTRRPAQRHVRRAADCRAGVPDVARAAAGQGPQGRRGRSAGTATRPAGGHPLHLRWCDRHGAWSPGHRLARGGHRRSPRRRRCHAMVGRRDRRALPAEPGAVPDVARRPLARPGGPGRGRAHRRGPSAAQQGFPARTGPALPVARLARDGAGPRPVRPHGRAGDRPHQDHAGTSGPHRLPADAGRADPRRLGARGAGLLRRGTDRGRVVGRRGGTDDHPRRDRDRLAIRSDVRPGLHRSGRRRPRVKGPCPSRRPAARPRAADDRLELGRRDRRRRRVHGGPRFGGRRSGSRSTTRRTGTGRSTRGGRSSRADDSYATIAPRSRSETRRGGWR